MAQAHVSMAPFKGEAESEETVSGRSGSGSHSPALVAISLVAYGILATQAQLSHPSSQRSRDASPQLPSLASFRCILRQVRQLTYDCTGHECDMATKGKHDERRVLWLTGTRRP